MIRISSTVVTFLLCRNFSISHFNDGLWRHLTVVISESTIKVLVDGVKIFNKSLIPLSLPLIRGGGVVTIGQKLQCWNAVFDRKMSFVGEMSSLNLLKHDVTRDTSCNTNCDIGQYKPVLQWNDLDIYSSGNILRVSSSGM